MELAEARRQHLVGWFFDCSHEIHRAIAGTYIADPKGTGSCEVLAPGFSQYVHDAILANAGPGHASIGKGDG